MADGVLHRLMEIGLDHRLSAHRAWFERVQQTALLREGEVRITSSPARMRDECLRSAPIVRLEPRPHRRPADAQPYCHVVRVLAP